MAKKIFKGVGKLVGGGGVFGKLINKAIGKKKAASSTTAASTGPEIVKQLTDEERRKALRGRRGTGQGLGGGMNDTILSDRLGG